MLFKTMQGIKVKFSDVLSATYCYPISRTTPHCGKPGITSAKLLPTTTTIPKGPLPTRISPMQDHYQPGELLTRTMPILCGVVWMVTAR